MQHQTATRSDPPISVVIPTYNRARLVQRALNSAMAALCDDDEIIVVDDGSTDDTLDVLQSYGSRINVVPSSHQGAGPARNLGVRTARNTWVAFLDSDDEWDADKIELQRPLLSQCDGIAFMFTDFRVKMPAGDIRCKYIRNWSKDARPWTEILGPARRYSEFALPPKGRADFAVYEADLYRDLVSRSYLAAFTYLFRKDIAEPLPSFATGVATLEDWQFFAEVARHGKGLYLDCETATQHGHAGPRLTDAGELDVLDSRLTVMERVWGQDQEFLRDNAQYYSQIRGALQQRRNFIVARGLAFEGKLKQARSTLIGAGKVPWKYRLLLSLPDAVVYGVTELLRLLRQS